MKSVSATYEMPHDALKGVTPICYGYKAVEWDGGTKQNYKYGEPGEELVGRAFTVDGDISECNWGLHFSKDPAYVFNFYEPLGYNRYFKVAAYDKAVDAKDGYKTVAQTIEFLEEYNLMEFVQIIKRFDRSNAVSYSTAVNASNAVSWSYGLRKCDGMYRCFFCVGQKGKAYHIFNCESTEKRIEEIRDKINEFNWYPQFANWYDIKGNKKWWAFCFPQLANVDNDIAWSKIPAEMLEYIQSLPEYDADVWAALTGK